MREFMIHLNPKRRKEIFTLVLVFVLVLLASATAVYLIAGRTSGSDTTRVSNQPAERTTTATPPPNTPEPQTGQGILADIFAPQSDAHISGASWGEILAKLTLRLLLAALLGAALAFRPRRQVTSMKRNPYVAQTQILLAVVASALMIIVGDNAARAFGIFAAVSLVRFRTNIRDPKEITVLLISLALGLATGVGRWDLALVLTLFSLAVLWLLEYREPEQVFRALDLKVNTTDIAATHEVVREVFEKHGFDSELRVLGRQNQENGDGNVVYSVDMSPTVTTDELSEEILARDAQHVISIEWEQKKSFSYLYQ
jgi:uncharacterized membrane protein YhiD involved in acid resistance